MIDGEIQCRIGERLRERRLTLHKKQAVVAGLAGITTDYLYQLERGKKLPTLPVLIALARVLQVSLDHLTNGDAVAVARQPARLDDDLYLALTNPPAAGLPAIDAITFEQQVSEAWRLWQTSPLRYSAVAARLPALLVQVQRQLIDTNVGAAPTGAERQAPEDMQRRQAAHRIVHSVIRRARPPIAAQAAELADRIHAPLT